MINMCVFLYDHVSAGLEVVQDGGDAGVGEGIEELVLWFGQQRRRSHEGEVVVEDGSGGAVSNCPLHIPIHHLPGGCGVTSKETWILQQSTCCHDSICTGFFLYPLCILQAEYISIGDYWDGD